MTGEKLKEFIRRLTAEGFEPDFDELGEGTVRDGDKSVFVMDDGEIRNKPESRALAYRVRAIRDEVDEYMAAYLAAAPGVERFPQGGKEDTRTLIAYAGHELAARRLSDGSVDFVTWMHARGHRDMGHYFDGYASAKEDFALRCGLIDRRKLFTETELRLIRSGLAEIGDITPDRGVTEMAAIRAVVEKIDDIVIPELAEYERDAEDQGYEPEIDL